MELKIVFEEMSLALYPHCHIVVILVLSSHFYLVFIQIAKAWINDYIFIRYQ